MRTKKYRIAKLLVLGFAVLFGSEVMVMHSLYSIFDSVPVLVNPVDAADEGEKLEKKWSDFDTRNTNAPINPDFFNKRQSNLMIILPHFFPEIVTPPPREFTL